MGNGRRTRTLIMSKSDSPIGEHEQYLKAFDHKAMAKPQQHSRRFDSRAEEEINTNGELVPSRSLASFFLGLNAAGAFSTLVSQPILPTRRPPAAADHQNSLERKKRRRSKRHAAPCASLTLDFEQEVKRRRNLAIISHPDAGKTTLTEKLLLYGGAIQSAGAVKAKGEQRRATSDFMELEKQRGISISSTVLSYEYAGKFVNILDTPGHQDFSEDTYRTLAAADNAVMLIDAAKGLEPQTKKLFAVARLRRLPLFTFVNKLDREARSPYDLCEEIEKEFGIAPAPVLWPIGSGDRFKGVLDRRSRSVSLFERGERGAVASVRTIAADADELSTEIDDDELYSQFTEDLVMLDEFFPPLDMAKVMQGEQTPVFFWLSDD
jgi:small GTP-binding protein